jgi:hypothetical protein
MRIFLDDTRPAPEGWTLVRWPEEAIDLLETGAVHVYRGRRRARRRTKRTTAS